MFALIIGITVFVRILWNAMRDPQFRGLAGSVAAVLAAGTTFYSLVEDWSVLDSLYFSVITLTTVGFGDFAPETAVGKLFTSFYIYIGLGFIMASVPTIVHRSRSGTMGFEDPPRHHVSEYTMEADADVRVPQPGVPRRPSP